MTTRRHRIVIKPNIRPAAAKTGPTNTPKQKIPSNAASECPSPAIRPQLVSLTHEETHQLSASEDDKEGNTISNAGISTHVSECALGLPENGTSQDATPEGADSEQTVSSVAKEAKSEAQSRGESTHTRKEKSITDVHDVSADDVSVKGSSNINAKSGTNAGTPVHHKRNKKSVTLETANQAPKQKDIDDSEEVIKDVDDDNATTPSEADGSCMSDVMSLDPDNERGEEVGDKAHKKNRRHKSKKLRVEPLPSREKSPDRQKMKMGDLLCWNPQQNFLPRKNKKKAPLTNENRSVSPTSSLPTAEDDKDSNESASLPAPQVMIGPDGSVILNTESLMIQTQKEERPIEVIEDNDEDRYLNTNSYRKYKKAKLWTERETEKFFVGLSMCGTDFSLLSNLLTHRSRRELKNKFHREERRNRELIDKALSSRQQYDLTPFKKLAAEDDKKIKKALKKQMKKESLKEEKVAGRQAKKRKKESVDEEGDWFPGCDEEDAENQDKNGGSDKMADTLVVTHKSKGPKVKREADYQNKPVDPSFHEVVPEDTSKPFVPGYLTASVTSVQDNLTAEVPLPIEYSDLDNPRMRSRPAKTYSKLNSENRTGQQQTSPPANLGTNFTSSNNVIQSIPGSTQVQIEMEGVQNPVQGVLIPSHMVPQIAPQLGIYGSAAGMQVLLVQEETESGTLVHVYVLPESDTARASGDNGDGGLSGAGSHLSFSSPIPSPHPTTSIQNPHTISPFPASPHPLSSVCSPQPDPTYPSPPPLLNPTTGDFVQRPHPQMHTPLPPQSLCPQSPSARLNSSSFNQDHQDMVVIMPPPAGNHPISRQSQNASAIKYNSSSSCEQVISDYPHNHLPQISTGTSFTPLPSQPLPSQPLSSQPVPIALFSNNTSAAVSHQTPNMLPHSSQTPVTLNTQFYHSDVIVIVEDEQTVRAGDGEVDVSPYNSISVVGPSEATDDDCIVLNSDGPQSRVDISGMSGL